MSNLTKNPPVISPEAESFIKSAEQKEIMPWNAPSVRKDVCKILNFRIREKYFIKLAYLAEKKEVSMNKICLDALVETLNRELGE